jgi:hypothetical protein
MKVRFYEEKMSAYNFDSLLEHQGHEIVINTYENEQQEVINVAIECLDCNTVLLDYDRE